jgi:hypothetical protein
VDLAQFKTKNIYHHSLMESYILPTPQGVNFADFANSDRFYRLTTAEVIHFRQAKYSPSVVTVYCYIKTKDPFGNGLEVVPAEAGEELNYNPRTVSRAVKALIKAGEIGAEIVKAHVRLVAKSVESVVEIVTNLGLANQPTPEPATIPIVETIKVPQSTQLDDQRPASSNQEPVAAAPLPFTPAPLPSPSSQSPSVGEASPMENRRSNKSGTSSIGNVIANMGFPQPSTTETPPNPDSTIKTPQWYDRVEFKLNAMDIKLADVLHALKKYSVQAIEDAIAYTQKQNWSKAKAGVFVNYLKKWTPIANKAKSKSKSAPESVKTALMEKFPDIATTLAQEQNPINEATFDYLQRLKVAGGIYDMQYSSIHNFFGVFITVKDYPHLIPWWDAVPQLQQLYPDVA